MCFFLLLLLLLLLCTPFSLSQTVTSLTFTHPPLTTPVCFFSRALHLSRRAHSLRCTYSGCKTLTPLSHTVPSFSSHSRKNTSSAIKHNDSVGVGGSHGSISPTRLVTVTGVQTCALPIFHLFPSRKKKKKERKHLQAIHVSTNLSLRVPLFFPSAPSVSLFLIFVRRTERGADNGEGDTCLGRTKRPCQEETEGGR